MTLAYEPDGRQIGRMLAAVDGRGSILVMNSGAPSVGIPADTGPPTPLIGIIESAAAVRPLAAEGRAVPASLSSIGSTSRKKLLDRAAAGKPFMAGTIVLAGGRDAALGEVDAAITRALRRVGALPTPPSPTCWLAAARRRTRRRSSPMHDPTITSFAPSAAPSPSSSTGSGAPTRPRSVSSPAIWTSRALSPACSSRTASP